VKKSWFLIVAVVAAVLAVGCASSTPAAAPAAEPAPVVQDDVPDFVLNPPNNEDVIYGIGSAQLSNSQLAMRTAEARARRSLAQTLRVSVQGMLIDYTESAGVGDDLTNTQFVQDVGRQLTDANLIGSKVVKRQQTKDKTWWVLMALSAKDAKNVVDSVISEQQKANARYAEYKANEAVNKMDQYLNQAKPEVDNNSN